MNKKDFVLLSLGLLFSGCAARRTPAPIDNVTSVPSYITQNMTSTYAAPAKKVVQNVATDDSGTQLGSLNDDSNPTTTNATQNNAAAVTPVSTKQAAQASTIPVSTPQTDATPAQAAANASWVMPTDGTVVQQFSAATKGVNFTGTVGQPIVAAGSGKVLYSGNGLKGYGNLIIIKHNATYLSAYALNKVNLVKEGDNVKAGQKIAEMGVDDSGKASLHFEIRQDGRPINPLPMLNATAGGN